MYRVLNLIDFLVQGCEKVLPFIIKMGELVKGLFSNIVVNGMRKKVRKKKNDVVCDMLQCLSDFLFSTYEFRYNLLTEQTEFSLYNKGEYKIIGKREMNSITLSAKNSGIDCWDKDVHRVVYSESVEGYHPFADYFESLPIWDGTDRVGELARRVSDNELWVNSFHTWMRATTAGWMGMRYTKGRANSVAPILISKEQGWSKSTFCRMLMPNELKRYFTESYDLNSPTSAEGKLADFGLINLDEFDKISARKMAQLKNLMQMSALNIRKTYQRDAKARHRIASFIGTSNRTDLLTDMTGSRRFICVELEKPIDCDTPVEHAHLYAQLKTEIEQGERYWFTSEEETDIQENNKKYYRNTPEEEVFYSLFRFANQDDEGAKILTAAEIFKEMLKKDRTALRGTNANSFSRLLPSMGKRIRTRFGNGYCVVRL